MRKPPRRTEVKIEREERTLRRVEMMPPGWKRTRVTEKTITLPRVRIGSDDEIAPKDLKRR